jgi:hypothetical protein
MGATVLCVCINILYLVAVHCINPERNRHHQSDSFVLLDDSSSSLHGATGSNDEEAAALVVRHMERLKGQWHGVLQDVVYER